MKSIQNQYIDLKEGRMSQANFMRNVRMTLPQYVTNVTSFKDAVRILKNKAILNEAMGGDPIEATLKLYLAKGNSYAEAIELTAAEQGMDEEVLMSQYPQDAVDTEGYEDEDDDEEFIDMIARAEKDKEEEEAIKSGFGIYDPLEEDDDEEGYPDEDYEDPDMFDAYGMDASEGLNEAKKKRKPKAELHPNQIHPQELRMGIKVELEHTDDLDKAKKIALDHLAENPFYYTALKLSGIESPSSPKAKYPVAFKKEVTAAVELVDKINAMKPVKGVEKAKASSNKARKETNKIVKGVEELTHNAQTVRGLQKFAATGGKMKAVREGQLNEGGEYMFSGTLTGQETADLKKMIPGVEIEEEELDDTYKTVISHPTYNEKTLRHAIRQVMGQLPSVGDKKDLGASFDKFKSQLESLVREVLDEIADGGDDMNPQYAENEY